MKKRNIFALLRTFMLTAFVSVLSFGFVSCEPDNVDGNEGGGTDTGIVPPSVTPDTLSYKAVDLGLSVKWATCNVGANSPEEYGNYFAWGETTTKSSYGSSNSVTYNLSTSELQSRGIIDSDGQLTAEYDAATANWGSPWRMPTMNESIELIDNCTWSWTTQNGVNGYKVTGPNGNSIFLPAAGSHCNPSLGSVGSCGYYWSATIVNDDSRFAYHLGFNSDYFGRETRGRRFYDYTVRPVTE